MNSILLGALALSGNSNNPYKTNKNKGEIQDYNSNIHKKMDIIEKQQVSQNFSKPEFLRQFDELSFDSISTPVGMNQAFTTTTGVNSSLQRNLDFQRGYSEFQESDMHYDVVTKDQFVHNNMTLGTTRRDFPANSTVKNRSLELFTGNLENYTAKKEKVPLFAPASDLTWVNGIPCITGQIANRYLASNKNNNGNLPFQNNLRVTPGVDTMNQEGTYAVYRVDPRGVDELRSEINQKTTYMNKPLETLKKGDIRAPDYNITKFKLPDFREQTTCDLVATRANISGTYTNGEYTNVDTMRNESENYIPGPAKNTSGTSGPDINKTNFTPAKKESYLNDSTHAVNAVNDKRVLQNIESFTNYENQRASTNSDRAGPAGSNSMGNYTIDYKDIPLVTSRELMIQGNTNIGITNTSDRAPYVFSNDMVLPTTNREMTSTNKTLGPTNIINMALYNMMPSNETIRESTSHNMITGTNPVAKTTQLYNMMPSNETIPETTSHRMMINTNPVAKTIQRYNMMPSNETIRETTSHNMITGANPAAKTIQLYNMMPSNETIRETTSHNIMATTASAHDKGISLYPTDNAKSTIRETTENTCNIGHANNKFDAGTYVRDMVDKAKSTIREMTEKTYSIGAANSKYDNSTYARDINDKAKPTIRETTEETQQYGPLKSITTELTYVRDLKDIARPTIRQSTFVQTPAGPINNSTTSTYRQDYNDVAMTTIKETTLLEDYNGGAKCQNDKKISHDAANNMTIDERREISTYNRPANAKGDLYGPTIDRENVKLNEPILYSYVPAPSRGLDFTMKPIPERKEMEPEKWDLQAKTISQTINSTGRPSISNSSYYITENRVNTLDNNPLVSDMYHHKGTSFIKY